MAEKHLMQIPREVRMLYTKGNEAVMRDNFDYAIDLLSQVLVREPGFIECRKALRKAQQGKASKTGGGLFRKILSSAGSSPLLGKAQLALRHNPAEALALAERILNSDANSGPAHRVVLEAARALDLPETLHMSLEVLYANSPHDKQVAIQYANALADRGQVAAGERVLAELAKALPQDADVVQALKDVSAKRTLKEGGYQALETGQGSYRDILRNEDEAKSLEQEKRVQKTEDVAERLILEYEGRLKTDSDNLKLVRSLAELYTQKKQFERAKELYAKIKSSEMGNDPTLDRAIAETRVKQFEHAMEQLDVNAADHEEQKARLAAEKLSFQVEECKKRVEKFPTDLAIRFEMGMLYFQMGKISEAIQEFQKAQNYPHKRIAAMGKLAQCFAQRKMFDLSARTLQNAIKEKATFDEEKKDLIYNLGVVLEGMDKKEEAIEQFKLIYEVDIGYRDVAAKVDAYYAGQ